MDYENYRKVLFGLSLVIIFFSCLAPVDAKRNEAIPRIDEEAAYIAKEPKNEEEKIGTDKPVKVIEHRPEIKGKSDYSQNFWVFMLGAYVFLMLFNLSSDFKNSKSVQWFWVSVFTFLAIFAWDKLDISRANTWFPKTVMEMGIMVYLFYLYFFLLNKKKIKNIF